MDVSEQDPALRWCLELLVRQRSGYGILGEALQLEAVDYQALCALSGDDTPGLEFYPLQQEQLKAKLLKLQKQRRDDEYQELYQWLKEYQKPSCWDIACIVASASMGFHHLWQDLGLVERPRLGMLMRECFFELSDLNQPPMRWKKFFYRQLCLLHGALVCRSPSCSECSSYSECFAQDD